MAPISSDPGTSASEGARAPAIASGAAAATANDHFGTDHLLPNLRRRTISSGGITFASQGFKFLLTLVSTVVLARLLSPKDFGLVALVTSLTGFLRVFKEAGLSIATVQRDQITHAQVSNLFWINVAVSAGIFLVIAGLGPGLAWFYGDDRLILIALTISTTYLISGSTVQHRALLRRQMQFKKLAIAEVGSMCCGVATAVGMALSGFGYWSLVGSAIAIEVSSFLLIWFFSPWRPGWPSRNSGTRALVEFGAARTTGDFLISLARGSDYVLIGRFYGSESLGLYSRASALLLVPLRQLLGPINSVFIPALSRLNSNPERYRSTFFQLYKAIALASFFITGVLFAVSHPLVLVLLGPQWEGAAMIFGGFVFASLCLPLADAAAWLFTTQGRGKDMLYTQATYATVLVLSFVCGLPYGPVGIAWALSACILLIRLPLYYYRVGRAGPVRTAELWKVFFSYLPIWFATYLPSTLALRLMTTFDPSIQLMSAAVAGLTGGVTVLFAVPAYRRAVLEFRHAFRDIRIRKRKTT